MARARNPELAAQDAIIKWRRHPQAFFEEALKISTLTTQQKHALDEIGKLVTAKRKASKGLPLTNEEKDYNRKLGVSIMSGMGTGKDALAAGVIIWFLSCFPRPVVPCTAPTAHQLRDNLWKELNKWRVGEAANPPLIRDWFTWQTDRFFQTESKGREWYAVARTANPKANSSELEATLQGFHEPYMMIVVDEAAGVPDAVFKPLEGTLTGECNFLFLIFNPNHATGFAIDTQTKDRERWVCLHWDAEESELVSKSSVEEKARKYGRDSNYFRVTVKGYPPRSSSDALIPWEWAVDAIGREVEPRPDDPLVCGVDVGAGGDPTICLTLQGPKVLDIEQCDTGDSEVLTNWLVGRALDHEPAFMFVDTIGVGWAIEGGLRARLRGTATTVIGVNVAEVPSTDEGRYFRLRDELAWRVRERFEQRVISIPDDPGLIAELTTVKYDEPGGKVKLESKREIKKRIESPNKLDALMLAHYMDTEITRRLNKNRGRPRWRGAESAGWRVA